MNPRFEQSLVSDTLSVKQALGRINTLHGVPLTLFVIDRNGALAGTLTDGDIRRGLLSGVSLEDDVTAVMQTAYCYITHNNNDASARLKEARLKGIAVIPVLDDNLRIKDIIDLRLTYTLLPVDAVLMAGGRGERLRPLTDKTPKPLLPVGGKPIIDYNIEALRHCGISDIFVTVNYLHEQIEAHFAAKNDTTLVRCILEPAPLGTFGSIGLIKELKHDNVLVMNSDLLTSIDFEKLYEHHTASGAALTMAVITYAVSVPYAIVKTERDRVSSFQEKPTYNFFANAGIYIVKREMLDSVTGTERVDATDFMDSLLERGLKISYFPIDGTWIDIGSPDDYAMACSKMNK